ncbi:DUF397 domain-containing protein [Actinoalloteichus hymeniacidonis]|uniref:DUF397 family protein n=1 Tax=Actinoalloteichus hymeniacidonis TaxID=340345 RepID=A0AAC9HTS1_9PSEU|nr:DUF397 domain-containing protein [Actinoalloteichus hymeniacidonis]AOS65245.1 putative DUF397 family protein [Actinoalloteichus hymeniacidonis]MBB5906674.1 hypothetical protein [Actinoalloteichus hymeniacidonis]
MGQLFTAGTWRKSIRSNGAGNCVEVATIRELIGVRDSKNPNGPVLWFPIIHWMEFLDQVEKGPRSSR